MSEKADTGIRRRPRTRGRGRTWAWAGSSRVKGSRPKTVSRKNRAFARRGVEVAVGSQRRAELRRPAPPGPHDVEEALDIDGHGLGRLAAQHLLEMPPRERVLLLQEEGARQFEPHAHKLRAVHQDRPKRGDGLVELLVAGLPVRDGMGGGQRLHSGLGSERRSPRGSGCVQRRRRRGSRRRARAWPRAAVSSAKSSTEFKETRRGGPRRERVSGAAPLQSGAVLPRLGDRGRTAAAKDVDQSSSPRRRSRPFGQALVLLLGPKGADQRMGRAELRVEASDDGRRHIAVIASVLVEHLRLPRSGRGTLRAR